MKFQSKSSSRDVNQQSGQGGQQQQDGKREGKSENTQGGQGGRSEQQK